MLRNGGNPQLLDSYEAERKPLDEAVIRQTDRATRLVSLHGTVARFIRDHMMSLLTQIPAVTERLGDGLSGLAVNYRRSPIVEEHAPEGRDLPRATGRPMHRSSQRRTGNRGGSTISSPSTAMFCCCWAMAPRPHGLICSAIRKPYLQRIASPRPGHRAAITSIVRAYSRSVTALHRPYI